MKKPKETFNKNGLIYTLVKRTETVAMFKINSMESGACYGYEVWDIPMRKAYTNPWNKKEMEEQEGVPSNEEFGIKFRSKALITEKKTNEYFDLLVNTVPDSNEYWDGVERLHLGRITSSKKAVV
jgi:hypothetical protein